MLLKATHADYATNVRHLKLTLCLYFKRSLSANISYKDEFDVFSGNKVDVAKVQKGKRRDRANLKNLLSDKSHITESVKERYSAYDVFNRHVRIANLYDDEYDDTYDSHNVGAQDADSADELTIRRWVVV